MISNIYDTLRKKSSALYRYRPAIIQTAKGRSKETPPAFGEAGHARVGLRYLIEHYSFETVIDVGSGTGRHAKVFEKFGKTVTRLDYGESNTFKQGGGTSDVIKTNINTFETDQSWDVVWASHILEHQPNVQLFIQKLFSLTQDNGIVAITVPPLSAKVVGGHFTTWTQGLLLFNIALAGFSMRDVEIFKYGGNITLIARKAPFDLPQLGYCKGDVEMLSPYLPDGFFHGIDGSRIEIAKHPLR